TINRGDGGPIQLRRTETALIALLRSAFRPRATQIVVIATPERTGQLPVKEKWHVGFHGSRTHRIAWDQPLDRRFDEGQLGRLKKYISGTGKAGRCIRRSLLPGNRSLQGLRWSSELAVAHARCRTDNPTE